MPVKRPFTDKKLRREKESLDEGEELRKTNMPKLPLPTPQITLTKPSEPSQLTEELPGGGEVNASRLEAAKKVFQTAGLDPSILDKLVERSIAVDKEIERLQLQIEELQGRIRQLLEEKKRISRVINALAQA